MTAAAPAPAPKSRVVMTDHLERLVGGHPRALRDMFEAGRPASPAELGARPRGRLLTLETGEGSFLLLRPFSRLLGGAASPWEGKAFDQGGNGGTNVVLGRSLVRFRSEVAPSRLDGKPCLVLRYDEPAFGNPWPIRALVDELRAIGEGVAIGPALFSPRPGQEPRVLFWFGLEARA